MKDHIKEKYRYKKSNNVIQEEKQRSQQLKFVMLCLNLKV